MRENKASLEDKHIHFPKGPKLSLKPVIKTESRMEEKSKFQDILPTKCIPKIRSKKD